jgi:signal transduction histidine kinase
VPPTIERAYDPAALRAPTLVPDPLLRAYSWLSRRGIAWWEVAAAVAGVVAAAAAVIVTLRADFLAHPGWLALQKADVILGPIGVGIYWRRRRPQSRFGPMLIAVGLLYVPYVFQSTSNAALFTLGVHWEGVIYLATLALILGFPTGHLDRPLDRLILTVAALGVVLPSSAITLFSPQIFAGGSISACKAACPANALHFSVDPAVVTRLVDVDRAGIIAVAVATAALLLRRLVTGTPPQRRALAIGTPIALLFLVLQAGYQVTILLGGADFHLNTFVRWTFAGARSALWYGFLLALVAAELAAGRVLRRMVSESLRRPSLHDLEAILRRPLGDPGLRLALRQRGANAWADGDGNVVEPPAPGSGRALTEVDLNGRPAAAIVHDVQLADDPELLQAAGATALLAFENAELQSAWEASLRELADSRARIAAASARERRNLARDLHDGAQQALVATGIKLVLTTERAGDPELRRELTELSDELDTAINELRDLAHGIYPGLLADLGLVYSLKSVAQRAGRSVEVFGEGVGRYPPEIESALYYCCREALQNAFRHAGPRANISIRLRDSGDELRFEVRDDGRGFDTAAEHDGAGLRNMEDRISALDGSIEFVSAPGHGAVVSGAVPLTTRPASSLTGDEFEPVA